ncbi:hypothetical protein AGENTSMITH_53 [Bacillus phage vB_BspM_AgentSmith]|nr:hypothetical protein AGENTSMITH_53 [Bacillus phage vB_BspM_AgentSmith]
MLEKIKDAFKNLTIKKHSSTLDDDTGSSEDVLKSQVKKLIRKSQKRTPFTLEDINFLLNYCFGEPRLKTTTFKFHDSLARHMVFAISSVYIIADTDDHVTGLRFGMREILLGKTVNLDVSLSDLNELMVPVSIKIDSKNLH